MDVEGVNLTVFCSFAKNVSSQSTCLLQNLEFRHRLYTAC